MKTTQLQTPAVIAPPPVIYLASLALAFGANAVAPERIIGPPPVLYVVGAVFVLLSGAFARWAFAAMKDLGTSPSPYRRSEALTIKGPYKLSRNPIYVAMTGLYFGIALLGDSLWPFVFLVPLSAIMHWGVVLREERYLAHRFGEAYLAYKSRTRRWL